VNFIVIYCTLCAGGRVLRPGRWLGDARPARAGRVLAASVQVIDALAVVPLSPPAPLEPQKRAYGFHRFGYF
jgi:hypothetical protein